MRNLVITENITLDGVIDAAGDWFGPTSAGDDISGELREQRSGADAFLVGRRTFVDMRDYWAGRDDDGGGIAPYLDRVAKYVVSNTLDDPKWDNTTVLRGDPVSAIQRLKDADGADIVCTGSVSLTRTLISADLADEYRLFVHPVVLGYGARLFGGAKSVPPLRLLRTRMFGSGIVLLCYGA